MECSYANSLEHRVYEFSPQMKYMYFYNGNGEKGEQMREKESIPKHIKFVDKGDQEQVDKFYEREISIMRHLREARSEHSPFRNIIREPSKHPY